MDDDSPWGEDPDWVGPDEDGGEGGGRGDGGGGGDGRDPDDPAVFGAQHVLVLIDCHRSMFVPCVRVRAQNDDEDEDGAMDESDDDDATTDGEDDCGDAAPRRRRRRNSRKLVTPFDAALLACERLLRLRVNYVATSKSGKRDGVGIMLYGTRRRTVRSYGGDEDDRNGSGGGGGAGAAEVVDVDSDSGGEDSGDDSDDAGVGPAPALSSTYDLVPLAPPGTEQVLRIMRCLRRGGGPDGGDGQLERDLEAEFADVEGGEDQTCPLRSALSEASKSFLQAKCVKKNAARSGQPADAKALWIFTNRDDPTDGNDEERKKLTIIAVDAVDNGLDIHVWPLPRATGNRDEGAERLVPFRRDVFFDRITVRDAASDRQFDLERDRRGHAEVDLEEMLEDVHEQWKKLRRALTLPLLLPGWRDREEGGDPGIMMDFYRLIQIQRKPQPVTVHQTTNKQTRKVTQIIATETGEIIEKDQVSTRIRTYVEFGGERVPLSREEAKEIRTQSNAAGTKASLLLIGFKPIDSIPPVHILDMCYFCYPNEDLVEGSRAAFSALHASMLRKQVLAICEFLPRANSTSRPVALVPQAELRDDVGDGVTRQIQPPGFVLHHLPFEDDVRDIPEEGGEYPPAENAIVDCAVNLVMHQKLCGFDIGYSFENPALTNFWNFVESVALGEDLPERAVDETKNDPDELLEAAGEQIKNFRLSLPEDDVKEKTGTKRKANGPVADDSGIDWVGLFETDCLADCNVDALKKYLRSVGEKLGGRKADLVDRVKTSIAERLRNGSLAPSLAVDGHIKREYEDV